MKKYLGYIPGFRSDTKWKKVVASVFYTLYLLFSTIVGLDFFFLIGGLVLLPVAIFYFVKHLKHKKKLQTPVIILLAAIVFFNTGINISSEKSATANEIEQIDMLQTENEELKEEIKNLNSEIENLKEDNEKLLAENEDLTTENEDLKKENEELIADKKAEEEKRLAEEAKKEEEAKKQEEAKKAQASASSSTGGSSSTSTPAPKPAAAQPATSAEQSQEVLVTPTGKRYHARVCGNGNYTWATLAQAKARGLTPCQKCY